MSEGITNKNCSISGKVTIVDTAKNCRNDYHFLEFLLICSISTVGLHLLYHMNYNSSGYLIEQILVLKVLLEVVNSCHIAGLTDGEL